MSTDSSESRIAARGRALALTVAAAFVAGCSPETPDAQADPSGDLPPGFWFDERTAVRPADLGELGYADGYEAPDERWTGVRVHDPSAAYAGAMVLASGHEPAAHVLHPDGSLERRWALDRHPENAPLVPEPDHPTQRTWRRVEPLADDGLLAIHEGLCLLRLDDESRVMWAGVPGAHHDLEVVGEEVWTLDRRVRPPEGEGADAWIVDDGLARVDLSDGTVRQRLSILGLVEASDSAGLVEEAIRQARSIDVPSAVEGDAPRRALDPLHANALVCLPAAPNEIVVLLRDIGALASIDVVEGRLAWLRMGPWQGAHDPRVQITEETGPRGRVLLFDNFGRRDAARPSSRVLALSLPGLATETVYEDDPPEGFHSPVCGALAPLPGDLVLVVETTAGRAFQIDASGRLVWEFRSPFRVEERGIVAALLDMRPLNRSR